MIADDDIELGSENCPKCSNPTYERPCGCDEGYSHHDCGDDTCCCADPEPNVLCDICNGNGLEQWCPTCGWDLMLNRYINGCDARYRTPVEPPQ